METHKTTIQFPLFLFFLLNSINLQSQTIPEYLGEKSRETLGRVEKEIEYWDDLSIGLEIGFIISTISNDSETSVALSIVQAATESEDYTTLAEALRNIPHAKRARVSDIITLHIVENENNFNEEEKDFWNNFIELLQHPDSDIQLGRSYGDPHIVTYDGLRYSFQTVGEFILSRSSRGNFEVQVRQSAVSSSLAQNSAVAMNVGGDIVCVYMSDFPDSVDSTPLRVNGEPLPMSKKSYALSRGGVIRIKKGDIRVSWATGEQVIVQVFNVGEYKYLNIIPQIYTSENIKYDGLLGNANGNPKDDLKINGGINVNAEPGYFKVSEFVGLGKMDLMVKAKKIYQKKLSRDFGDSWRISDSNSLFDYKPEFNTDSYTDYGFPNDYLTLSQLSVDEIRNAQKVCEEAGVVGEDLQSCIYDVAFTEYNGFARSTARAVQNLELLEEFGINNPLKPLLPNNLKEKVIKNSEKKIKRWIKKLL